jgi:hypothetical protein
MTDLKQELVALENKYWTAMLNKDVAAALEMSADPCIVTGAQGNASNEDGAAHLNFQCRTPEGNDVGILVNIRMQEQAARA